LFETVFASMEKFKSKKKQHNTKARYEKSNNGSTKQPEINRNAKVKPYLPIIKLLM